MKCVKCDKEATYDSPALLCDVHWAAWWVEGMKEEGYSDEEIEEAYQGALSIARGESPERI